MADQFDTQQSRARRRSPSLPLLLSGIAALVVSGWALAGPDAWHGPADFDGVSVGWILVVVAIVIGALLVFTPSRRKR